MYKFFNAIKCKGSCYGQNLLKTIAMVLLSNVLISNAGANSYRHPTNVSAEKPSDQHHIFYGKASFSSALMMTAASRKAGKHLLPEFLHQQLISISGKVVDEKNMPLPGVTVKIKDSQVFAKTDNNGYFTIKVPDEGAVLLFSFVGYVSQEKVVGTSTEINIILQENNAALNDVVVIGYGQQKKVSVTGSVASVSSKQLKQSPVADLSNALAGRLPGLITLQTGGEPGFDGSAIWIRGFGSYVGGAQTPLILVDGVERSFNNLDPNEVESISILKDASSTAVFGVRGANGVVLVTTKRGLNHSKPLISATYQTGIQSPTRLPKYLDSYDALLLYREGLKNDGLNAALYTDEYLNKFRDRSKPAYEYLYPNVDWFKELIKPNSLMNQANLNVSGGTTNVRYFVSLGYLRQSGLYKGEESIKNYNVQAVTNRYNFRSNLDIDIVKNLAMELGLGQIVRDRNYPNASAGDIWNNIKLTPSWRYPLTNPNGTISGVPALPTNPYGLITQSGYSRFFESTLQATTGFTLKLPWLAEGLSIRTRASFDALSYRDVRRPKGIFIYQYQVNENETDLSKGNYAKLADGTNTLGYDVGANMNRRTFLEAYVNYDRTFGKHAITGMVLYNQQSYFDQAGSGNAIGGLPFKYQGIVGRATYGFNQKYFAEFNFGYNGSEQFMEGHRFGFFPAVSFGWLISNENFIKNNLPAISLLKIRGSAGIVGNDKIGGARFLYQDRWDNNGPGYTFGRNFDQPYTPGAIETATGNVNVSWEEATKYNLGLELGILDNVAKLEADIFYEKRRKILTPAATIPDFLGVGNVPNINAGIVQNKGFEISLEHSRRAQKHGYFVRANFSFARNRILDKAEPSYKGREWQAGAGKRINEAYGLTAIGLFKDQADIKNSPVQTFGNVQPGDIKYLDINGDGQINSQDEGYLGKVMIPESIFGFSVGYNYRGFDISVLLQGALGGNVWYTGSAIWPYSRFAGVLADVKDNYWTPQRTDAKWPRMGSNDNPNNFRNSTFWLRSRDYIRLKNAEIGYSLPQSLIKKVGLSNARFYANGINLLTLDKSKIFDPEVPDGTGNYPQQKVINFGLNVSF